LEEPTEPPPCQVRIRGGVSIADKLASIAKEAVYTYNTKIRGTGYYLKPVHYVYKRTGDGRVKVYEYYGRYWWMLTRSRGRVRWRYAGTRKPLNLPEPPRTGLEGLRIIRDGDDIIVDCWVIERFSEFFKGYRVERM